MSKRTVTVPTEEELRNRISRHLARRDDKQAVALVWGGYLAALIEWGLLDAEDYATLTATLPPGDPSEVVNVLTGFRDPGEELSPGLTLYERPTKSG